MKKTMHQDIDSDRASDRARSRAAGSKALRALTSGAMALPGLAGNAGADSAVTQMFSDFNYSRYSEDPIKSSKVIQGDNERYEIDLVQASFQAPFGENKDIAVDFVHESMSGASPWFIVPDTDTGEIFQVMSGATIKDNRTDLTVTGNFYRENGKSSISGGFSNEDDYLSLNVGLSGDMSFNDKLTTLSGGLGASIDEVDPVDSDNDPNRIDGKDYKHSYSLFGGVSRVLSRNTVVQTSLSYQHSRGFLDDPYKQVWVGGALRADSRPGGRHQISWLTRFRRHSERFRGTLHADYRLYADSWDVTSHTFELAWWQDILGYAQLVPSIRYYSQSAADFYAPFVTREPNISHYSSDYRLSNYGALAFRAKLLSKDIQIGRVSLSGQFSYERYMSDANMALTTSNDEDNPGLVDYNLFTVGLSGRF